MVLHSPLLAALAGIEHGFGTRQSANSQEGMASLTQIHSTTPLVASEAGCAGRGDALLTSRAGLAVSVRTADCFPILLADPGSGAVAAVHAGWRGAAGRIVRETLARMRAEFGTEPKRVWAAIGPGIGACCYPVGLDVARRFGLDRAGPLDLASENRKQLVEEGVPGSQIDFLNLCTCCGEARFHSWRRDKERAGRMISFIALRHR
jgi:hypothetical protein